MSGPDVKAVQEGFNKYYGGNVLKEDAAFGPKTSTVVQQFQKENGLQADGVVGPVTRSALFPLVGATVNFWFTRKSSLTLNTPQLKLPPFSKPAIPVPQLQLKQNAGQSPATPKLQLLPNLPTAAPDNDWIQPVGLPDKVGVPKVATPPGGRIQVDWQQVVQTQRQFTGLYKNPQDSFAIGWQSVFKRKLADPNERHLEIATGCLLQSPIGFQDKHGNDFTLACFAQATWVESLGSSGVFSWAPYAQVQGQGNTTGPVNATGSLGAFPLNFNIDLSSGGFQDLTLQLGAGVTGALTMTPEGLRSTWGLTGGVGLNGKIWFLGN